MQFSCHVTLKKIFQNIIKYSLHIYVKFDTEPFFLTEQQAITANTEQTVMHRSVVGPL